MSTTPRRLPITKGHGTQNDFVLLDDRAGAIDLSPALVRALADRRTGVGGDGVIRLVASEHLPAGADCLDQDRAAVWFMDYHNADGSVAEMCGNGVRVVARYAEHLGLWDGTGELVLGTRAGVRRIRRVDPPEGAGTDPSGAGAGDAGTSGAIGAEPWYAVDMGPWAFVGGDEAAARGIDAEVEVAGLPVARPALSIDVGNPHTVLALAGLDELDAADLTRAPAVTPVPPNGTNVELIVPLGEATDHEGHPVGRLRMRVHERGVGETWSCGTGACAAALAARHWGGPASPSTWLVQVPGGRLRVRVLDGGHVELAGPATLVAEAEVDLDALPR